MINGLFNILISCLQDIFGDTVAITVGNAIAFNSIGAIAIIMKMLGIM